MEVPPSGGWRVVGWGNIPLGLGAKKGGAFIGRHLGIRIPGNMMPAPLGLMVLLIRWPWRARGLRRVVHKHILIALRCPIRAFLPSS